MDQRTKYWFKWLNGLIEESRNQESGGKRSVVKTPGIKKSRKNKLTIKKIGEINHHR
jgi:hypothetical protein